ncbi:hypothetical protein [Nocardia arizonensis]|uniref:hypothetical protein n=1 Tax=Nocardia arizonensis TaxID=1141647 RepID=UPI000A721E5F|nr:hypothetical protein [Nocardia arizonensis]
MSERNETTTTITGAAPSVAAALKQAAQIAADRGRNWFGVEDLLAALLTAQSTTPLSLHWQRQERGPLTYDELRDFAVSLVPGSTRSVGTPAEPATVSFSATGPNASEFTALVDQA